MRRKRLDPKQYAREQLLHRQLDETYRWVRSTLLLDRDTEDCGVAQAVSEDQPARLHVVYGAVEEFSQEGSEGTGRPEVSSADKAKEKYGVYLVHSRNPRRVENGIPEQGKGKKVESYGPDWLLGEV